MKGVFTLEDLIKTTVTYVIQQAEHDLYYMDTIPDSEGDFINLFDADFDYAKRFKTEAQAERYLNMLLKRNNNVIIRKVTTADRIIDLDEAKNSGTINVGEFVYEQPVQYITVNLHESSIKDLVNKISDQLAKQTRTKGYGSF